MNDAGNLVYLLGKNGEIQSKLLQMTPKFAPACVAIDEIKETAAIDMLTTLVCGYAGIMTLEAHSAYHALTTLEKYVSVKVKFDKKIEKIITDRIDLIICLEQTKTGCKQIKEVAELRRYAFSEYQLTYI